MLTALPNSFLDPLLSFGLLEDAEIRLLVLEILVSLIDRHDNLPKFSTIRLVLLSRLKSDQSCNHLHLGCSCCPLVAGNLYHMISYYWPKNMKMHFLFAITQ